MPVQWEKISDAEFLRHPEQVKPTKTDSDWEELLTALHAGQSVRIPFNDEKDKLGKRLSLGRRASRRGFKVEIRYGDGVLVARKSEETGRPESTQRPAEPMGDGRRRGRRAAERERA